MTLHRQIKNTLFTTLFLVTFHFSVAQNQSCLDFDGTNDYIESNNTALNQIGFGDFTLEAWVKGFEHEQNLHPMIISNRPNSGSGMLFFFHSAWGASPVKMLCVQLNGRNYVKLNNGTFQGSILDGNLHHVAAVKSDSLLKFYVDGNFIGLCYLHPNTTVSSTAKTWIGQDIETNNTFNGTIGHVRIWDYARSNFEIQANMHNSIPIATPGLLANWELNEGFGQIAIDKTNNANGTLGSSLMMDDNDPTWQNNCSNLLSSIKENYSNKITLFPNPASTNIHIQLTEKEDYQIRLYNSVGIQVYSKQILSSTNLTLDIEQFTSGIYLIHILSSAGNELRTSFIKN